MMPAEPSTDTENTTPSVCCVAYATVPMAEPTDADMLTLNVWPVAMTGACDTCCTLTVMRAYTSCPVPTTVADTLSVYELVVAYDASGFAFTHS